MHKQAAEASCHCLNGSEVMQQKHPVRNTAVVPPAFCTGHCFITQQSPYLIIKVQV